MSFGKRLFNIARAEIKSAADKVKHSLGASDEDELNEAVEEEVVRARERAERITVKVGGETAEIRRYYANLELPIGATTLEVKAAYRRLMRRYHPDLHHGDREKAEVATKLSQELRMAYERLLAHLESRGR